MAIATRAVPHLSAAERVERGRAARTEVPRAPHAGFAPVAERPDPVELLEGQAETRVPELVPIRYGRMLVSPFAFYRGAALIMAADLAETPPSGLTVQCCGDAHLSNFGVFASPERELVFDINDFDETLPGPWEWDVKRLAASVLIAARSNGFHANAQERVVLDTVARYRTAMAQFAAMNNLEVWYAHLDTKKRAPAVRLAVQAQDRQANREGPRERPDQGQRDRVLEADACRRRDARIVDQSALDRPDRATRRRDRERDELLEVAPPAAAGLPRDAGARPPCAAGELRTDRPGPQGGRGRQRRYPRVDRAVAGPRPPRPPAAADQGGRTVRARERFLGASLRQPRPTGRRRAAADAGRQRHPPRLAARRHDRAWTEAQTTSSSGQLTRLEGLRGRSSRWSRRGWRRTASCCGWTLARAHARTGDRIAIAAVPGQRRRRFDRAIVDFSSRVRRPERPRLRGAERRR